MSSLPAEAELVHSPGLHRFALATAFSTLLLLVAGGLVTSTGSSLSVPDWPLSFGQVFPEMTGGVLYEHGHRLIAAGVGILTVALMIALLRRERRRWVRRLGMAAFVAVVAQGILGGVTVLLRLPLVVSVAHACLAQAFFCIVVTLAFVTSRGWLEGAGTPDRRVGATPSLAALSAVTTSFIYLQLISGALVRHTGSGLAIPDFPLSYGRLVPPLLEGQILIAYLHRLGAVIVSFLVVWTSLRVIARARGDRRLFLSSILMLAALALQIALGGITVLSSLAVVPSTAHVAVGALLLALSLLVTLRAFRLAWESRGGARRNAVPVTAAGGLPLRIKQAVARGGRGRASRPGSFGEAAVGDGAGEMMR